MRKKGKEEEEEKKEEDKETHSCLGALPGLPPDSLDVLISRRR